MKRVLITVSVCFTFFKISFSQPEAESSHIKIQAMSPHAPNTASLGKYFDVPVNMSSGVPTITIPLYTIKTGGISIPISLSYHASGNKVNTAASWVGMGWDLSFGGIITKQVNGLDDFYSESFYDPANGTPAHSNYFNPDYTIDDNLGFNSMSDVADSLLSGAYATTYSIELSKLVGRIILNKYDGESDEYHYSMPGGSGTIFYNQKTASFQTSEIDGAKVYYSSGGDDWTIKTKDGAFYNYEVEEETMTQVKGVGQYYSSAWYLSSISDISGRTITYEYDISARKHYQQGEWQNRDYQFSGGSPTLSAINGDYIRRYGRDINVRTIHFPEGRIEFVKDSVARIDSGVNALRKIKIYDKDSILRKQFNLDYIYVGTISNKTARLFLRSVQEVDPATLSTTATKPYSIDYDTSVVLPTNFSYAQDKWGYYNGKTSNTTMQPKEVETVSYGIPNLADRYVDTMYTKASVIKKIQYPTGGTLSFEFENNRDINDSLVGGLRIKKITNYDSVAGKALTKEYKYNDDNGSSTGYIYYRPKFHYFLQKGLTPPVASCRISGEPILPLFVNQGSPIIYQRVEEIQKGDSIDLKARYYSHSDPSVLGIPVDVNAQGGIGVPRPKQANILRFLAKPYKTEVFKREGGQYVLLEKTDLGYSFLGDFRRYTWNVEAAWTLFASSFVEDPGNDPYSAMNLMNTAPNYNLYKMFQESMVNDVTEKTEYSGLTSLSTIANKTFDSTNGNVKRMFTVKSNGDSVNTYIKYASDFNYTVTSDPINMELNALIYEGTIGLPVETITTIKKPGSSEYVVSADLFFYKNKQLAKHLKLNQSDILLSSFTQAHNDNAGFYYDNRYAEESRIDSFDVFKNPTQLYLRSGVQSIIWDTDDVLATVENAALDVVAATSFETQNKGRWTFSGSVSADTTSPTGSKCYQTSGGSITKSGLTSGIYIVSYWGKNGSVNVNSAGPTRTGKTVGNWTYYEHELTTTSITVSGSNYIDELRLYPKGAQMKTFTYKPLVGMTSQCDADNRIVYYEYDALNRLSVVRDQDKNIVKKICYNYAGQPENCTAPCTNTTADWQNIGAPVCQLQAGTDNNTGYVLQQQKDVNPCSSTYNQTQTLTTLNTTLCPPPPCGPGNCSGNDKKCINGVCETGVWSVVSSVYISKNNWQCTWAYCFSDGSTSTYTQTVSSSTACTITCI